jgi:hypothetical protein
MGLKRQMLTIRVSCFITERSRTWWWRRPSEESCESVRPRSSSSLSSSLASWIVWLIRKKAARNEMIAAVLELVFLFDEGEKGAVRLDTCERVDDQRAR